MTAAISELISFITVVVFVVAAFCVGVAVLLLLALVLPDMIHKFWGNSQGQPQTLLGWVSMTLTSS